MSKLLSEAWIDGVYLTAWPKAALIVPLSAFFFGLLEGATHWSFQTYVSGEVSASAHAVGFAQMLPLFFIAVIGGALSSQLGLLLVAGFALGDLLTAGTGFAQGHSIGWLLPHVYVPQLFHILIFLCWLSPQP